MIYFKCPTCKTLLANKQIPYEHAMDALCNNVNLTEQQRNDAKRKIMDDLEITRYCCRARVMGYVRLIEEIV